MVEGVVDTIEAGESKTVIYEMEVTGDGVYEPKALVVFADPDTGLTDQALGVTEINVTYPTVVKADLSFAGDDPVATTVNAGGVATAFLTLENMSNTETVTYDRSRLKVEGAAGGGFLTDIADNTPSAYVSGQIPVPTELELKPGATASSMHGYLYTAPNEGTRATITFDRDGEVTHPVRPMRVTTPEDLRWVADRNELRLSVLDPPAEYGDVDFIDVYGAFTVGFVEGSGRWLQNTWSGLESMATSIASGEFGLAVTDALAQAGAFVGTLSALEGNARRDYLFQTATQVADAQDRLVGAVQAEFESHMNEVFDAYYSGNTTQFARLMGGDLATVVWEVGMMEAAASGLVRAAAEARALEQLGRLSRQALRTIKSGAKITRQAAHVFGYQRTLVDDIALFANRNKLNITIKPRDPDAIVVINGRQAKMKPEFIKPKTVNDIDIDVLGFPASSKATVTMRRNIQTEIPDLNALRARFDDARAAKPDLYDEAMWENVVARWEKRYEEIDKYLPELDALSGLTLQREFNTVQNGVDGGIGVTGSERFDVVEIDDGVIELRLDDKPITSDVDVLSITQANGNPLSPAQRRAVYTHLEEIADIQHPETATWIKDGDGAIFGAKQEIFEEFTSQGPNVAPTNDPALQFGADGNLYAVRYNRNSRFESSEDYTILWDGGFQGYGDRTLTISGNTAGYRSLDAVDLVVGTRLAGGWVARTSDGDEVPSTQSNDPAARTYRPTPDGSVEEFTPETGAEQVSAPQQTPSGIQAFALRSAGPVAAPLAVAGSGGVWGPVAPETFDETSEVLVLPQTTLIDPVDVGESTLLVFQREQLETVASTGEPLLSVDGFFEPGQPIVIDPGGPNEEYAVVETVDPFTVREPLALAHAPAEMIAAIPAVGTNAAPVADAGGPYTVDEGTSVTLDGSRSSDPDGDDLTLRWDLDGDGTFETSDNAPSLTGEDGPSDTEVTVEACDPSGACDESSATVTTRNVAPAVDAVDVTVEGRQVSVVVSYSDPGSFDTHTVTVDWGDGTADHATPPVGERTVELMHEYAPGTTATGSVRVIDDDGAVATASFDVTIEASAEPLYRVRNGDPDRGERPARIYIERDVTLAGERLGIDDADPDGDGWAVVGRTNGAGDDGLLANSWVDSDGVPYAATRHHKKGCLTLTPSSLAEVRKGQVRRMAQQQDTANCRAEAPDADVDGDGTPDDEQPLYSVRDDGRRLILERAVVAAEAQLGISDWDPDRDGLARVARTNGRGQYGEHVALVIDGGVPQLFVAHPRSISAVAANKKSSSGMSHHFFSRRMTCSTSETKPPLFLGSPLRPRLTAFPPGP